MGEDLLVPEEIIESKILLIRGKKVMLDRDLAVLYGVETKTLNQAVKRNFQRFPDDFMFQLSVEEAQELLRSQFVTLKRGQHYKYMPYVFTENGVAMLSSVLNSERAIQVNIQIMRAFTRLREIMASHKNLARRLADLEKKYDNQFKVVFEAIRQLMTPPVKPKRKIGFQLKEKQARYGRKGRPIK
jgi:phage regulator Rha-like protein